MFSKNKEIAPSSKSLAMDPDKVDKIVVGTKIIGEIVSESPIRIEGTIQGNLQCKERVLIGKTGVVIGDIRCKDADIAGKVEGKIFVSNQLTLKSSANVKGEIRISKLEVEPGAIFNGVCSMTTTGNNGSDIPQLNSPNKKDVKESVA